jgi:hypothetical protein
LAKGWEARAHAAQSEVDAIVAHETTSKRRRGLLTIGARQRTDRHVGVLGRRVRAPETTLANASANCSAVRDPRKHGNVSSAPDWTTLAVGLVGAVIGGVLAIAGGLMPIGCRPKARF